MSDLPPGLEDFGRRLKQAAEREIAEREPASAPRRRRLRGIGLPVVAAVIAAGASAGAMRLADRGGEPIEPEHRSTSPSHAKDPTVVTASATANPSGGPPWAVRVYTDPKGGACVEAGRLRDGVFGQVQRGRFRPLPASASATCHVVNARGALVAVDRRRSVNLTVVYGLAPEGGPVTVRVGARRQRVQPVGLGTFLTLFTGADPHERVFVRSKVDGRFVERPAS